MQIRIHFTGRMYHRAADLPEVLNVEDGATIAAALALLNAETDEPLPGSCLVALNGEHLGVISQYTDRALRENDELTLIAPVAGG